MTGKVYDRKQLTVDRNPTHQLAMEVGKRPKINPIDAATQAAKFVEDFLLGAFKDVTGIDLKSWSKFLDGFPGLDASKIISGIFGGGRIPGLDASKIVSGVFGAFSIPGLDAGKIVSGLFGGNLIPGLDASKIVSGSFPVDRVTGLAAALARGDVGGVIKAITGVDGGTLNDLGDWVALVPKLAGGLLSGSIIPGLDASKIVSGLFGGAQIPSLDASKIGSGIFGAGLIPGLDVGKIVSGVFGAGRIPALDASKITTGTLPQERVSITSIAAGIVSGVLTAANIPGLDAGKITSGIFGAGSIPALDASKIASGTLGVATIPALPTSKITSGQFPQSMLNITSIASSILSGTLGAGLIPGLDASKITSGVFPQSMLSITSIAANIVNGVLGAGNIPGLDASKITTGAFAQSVVTGLTDNLSSLGTGIQGAINGIVNSLTGGDGANWSQGEANSALSAQAAATAAAAAALAQLQANNSSGAGGGVNVLVDFSTYPDSPALPSNFTTTYSGGSSGVGGTYGVTGGVATVQANEDFYAAKTFYGEYNVLDTVTDYQRISAVWSSSPGFSYQNPTPAYSPAPFYGAYRADTVIYCRYKDVNNWVRARFIVANQLGPAVTYLECCVNGTITQLYSNNHAFQANSAYYLEAGTVGNIRTFRLLLGSKVVLTYTDSSAVSQVGAAFRGGSLGGTSYGAQGAGVPANTSKTLYFAMQDNSPAAVVDSGARFYRAATGGVTTNGLLPSNALDTVEYRTDEYTFTAASNCRVTVSKKGWYVVSARFQSSATSNAAVRLYRNGTPVRIGSGSNAIFGSLGTWIIYLEAGDYLNMGTSASVSVVGSADGASTAFEITRAGKAA